MRFINNSFFIVCALVAITVVVILVFVLFFQPSSLYVTSVLAPSDLSSIEKEVNQDIVLVQTSAISGISCDSLSGRPFAVMMAADSETRPLSGIASADLVVEMPVITGSITRLMAVFQCEIPEEIGSIRSARHDFIPLAMGLDAIFVHWGGSHYALDKLNRGIMDNINALVNPYGAFYRNSAIPRPHNGFTSSERLLSAAEKLGYRLEDEFEGYQHMQFPISNFQFSNTKGVLKIGYPYPFNVKYEYNPKTNGYLRWRGGTGEIDKLTGEQVEANNVVVMRARSRQIEGQYNDVDVEGTGEAAVYRNGEEIIGTWSKDKYDSKSKLYFYDESGQEIEFVPGSIWIEVVEPYKEISWSVE